MLIISTLRVSYPKKGYIIPVYLSFFRKGAILYALLMATFLFSSCASIKTLAGRKNSKRREVKTAVAAARQYTGVKYKWGGTSRSGLDCSGLMYLSWKKAGKKIPRTSQTQSLIGKPVNKKKVKPGDMVFFGRKPKKRAIVHVGMVTEVSKDRINFIHASSSRGVIEDNLMSKYWSKRYVKARRVAD